MVVKVAIVGAYIRFTFSAGGTASYSRSDRFIIEVTAHNYISIYSIAQSDSYRQVPYKIIKQTLYSDITYDNGDPIGSTPQEVIDYFSGVFSLGVGFLYSADNYSNLLLEAPPGPTIPALSLAYVRNPQGTYWLPGPIGGNFYDRGIYLFNGVNWVSNRNDIAAALQILIADTEELNTRIDNIQTEVDTNEATMNAHISNVANPHGTTKAQVGLSNVPNIDATNPSNITQDATHRFATDAEKTTWNAKQNAIGYTPENLANKNQASGYAGLDSGGLIPAALLPSYVDDVLEFANLAAFPAVGATGKMYVAIDTGRVYRWSGSIYVRIANPGTTDDVIEGSLNFYFTTARVLATALSGLSLVTGTAIVSTDTILAAFGKLQKQITDLAALVPTAGQKAALVGNDGAPAAGNRYVTESGLLAALGQTGSAVTRALNTIFQVSATKYSRVSYTCQISATLNLSGSQAGVVILESANNSLMTGAVELARFAYSSGGGLTIGLNLTTVIANQVNGFGSPGTYYRLRTTGSTATVTYVSGQETIF